MERKLPGVWRESPKDHDEVADRETVLGLLQDFLFFSDQISTIGKDIAINNDRTSLCMSMPEGIMNLQTMLEGCMRRNHRSWEFFISRYGAVAWKVVELDSGFQGRQTEASLAEVMASMDEENCRFFKEFSGSSEREFLVHLRGKVLSFCRDRFRAAEPPVLDVQSLHQIFIKAPLAYQEAAWLALKGYSDEIVGKILRIPLTLARKGRSELLPRLSDSLSQTDQPCLKLDDRVLSEIEGSGGHNCVSVKIFSKVMDGQMPWRDKQLIEQHTAECLHCLDRETSLKEILFLLRNLPALTEELVRECMGRMTFTQELVASHSSFLTKVFKVFH
jgi:hypothetical protein